MVDALEEKLSLVALASSACFWVIYPSSTIRLKTCDCLFDESSGLEPKGEYLVGDCGKPANREASARVRSLEDLLKKRCEADSMP